MSAAAAEAPRPLDAERVDFWWVVVALVAFAPVLFAPFAVTDDYLVLARAR